MKKILIVIIILLVIILISSMSNQKLKKENTIYTENKNFFEAPIQKETSGEKEQIIIGGKEITIEKLYSYEVKRKSCTNLWIQRLLLWRRNLQHNRKKRRWNSLGKSSTRRHTKKYKILHERSKIFKIHLPPRRLGKETRLSNKKTM